MLEEIYTQMQTRLQEVEVGEAAGDPQRAAVDAAALPREPVAPRPAA